MLRESQLETYKTCSHGWDRIHYRSSPTAASSTPLFNVDIRSCAWIAKNISVTRSQPFTHSNWSDDRGAIKTMDDFVWQYWRGEDSPKCDDPLVDQRRGGKDIMIYLRANGNWIRTTAGKGPLKANNSKQKAFHLLLLFSCCNIIIIRIIKLSIWIVHSSSWALLLNWLPTGWLYNTGRYISGRAFCGRLLVSSPIDRLVMMMIAIQTVDLKVKSVLYEWRDYKSKAFAISSHFSSIFI